MEYPLSFLTNPDLTDEVVEKEIMQILENNDNKRVCQLIMDLREAFFDAKEDSVTTLEIR